MSSQETEHTEIDSGLASLIMVCRMLQMPTGYDEVRAWLGSPKHADSEQIQLVAKEFLGMKAKEISVATEAVAGQPLPALVQTVSGYGVVLKTEGDKVFFHDPLTAKTQALSFEQFGGLFAGKMILLAKDRRKKEDTISGFSLRWFISSFLHDRGIAGQILFAAFVIQLFALVTPLFTMIIIDKVFSSSGVSTLEVLIIGLFAIAIFDLLLGYSRKHLLGLITAKIDVIMVSKLFRHLTSLPLSFFSNRQTGDTISRFREVEFIRNFLSGSVLTALIDFPFGVIFLIVMYLFNPLLTAIVVIAIVLSFALYGFVGPFMKEKLKEKQQLTTESQSFLFETVSSIETIKAMSIEPAMQRRWEEHLGHQTLHSMETENLSGNIAHIAGFLNKGTVALCLWVGALAVLDGNMTAGQLIAFNMLVGRVMGPAQRLAQMLQQLHQVKISTKRVADIFNTKQEPALYQETGGLPDLKGAIRFEGVGFQYNPELPFVLDGIDLNIAPGEIVGIVGQTGSGKTTLLRLVQRLHLPTKGKIYIDGIDTSGIDPVWLRRRIGIVMQDNLLLNLSVKENILLANPFATMKQVEAAALLSGADEFIRKLPKAYDTVVGERGELISTGQRQRIALARALINNPKILILDEATSALDFESEMLIQKNLDRICAGRTVIIVSHRLSTLKIAQKLVCLSEGKIIESGTAQQLVQQKGYFARLHQSQTISGGM